MKTSIWLKSTQFDSLIIKRHRTGLNWNIPVGDRKVGGEHLHARKKIITHLLIFISHFMIACIVRIYKLIQKKFYKKKSMLHVKCIIFTNQVFIVIIYIIENKNSISTLSNIANPGKSNIPQKPSLRRPRKASGSCQNNRTWMTYIIVSILNIIMFLFREPCFHLIFPNISNILKIIGHDETCL